MSATLEVKLFSMHNRICAWEMYSTEDNQFFAGGARPFKSASTLESIRPSEFLEYPYTKKQMKQLEYIGKMSGYFKDILQKYDRVQPEDNYDGLIRNTFGDKSEIYRLYKEKALPPCKPEFQPVLYIDFEAINMRICGWYAELHTNRGIINFEGVARPYSDTKMIQRLWRLAYDKLLPYDLDTLLSAKHIKTYINYFLSMFRKAKRIYTYGDTDALFVKTTYGEDVYNYFKVKNVDASLKLGNRTLSLDKTCKLFGVHVEGDAHNPKCDVKKLIGYMEESKKL